MSEYEDINQKNQKEIDNICEECKEKDESVLYSPEVEEVDIMIVPQLLTHYTEPNKTYFKKRILSFDFILGSSLNQ